MEYNASIKGIWFIKAMFLRYEGDDRARGDSGSGPVQERPEGRAQAVRGGNGVCGRKDERG
jgi:hypothetical protein